MALDSPGSRGLFERPPACSSSPKSNLSSPSKYSVSTYQHEFFDRGRSPHSHVQDLDTVLNVLGSFDADSIASMLSELHGSQGLGHVLSQYDAAQTNAGLAQKRLEEEQLEAERAALRAERDRRNAENARREAQWQAEQAAAAKEQRCESPEADPAPKPSR